MDFSQEKSPKKPIGEKEFNTKIELRKLDFSNREFQFKVKLEGINLAQSSINFIGAKFNQEVSFKNSAFGRSEFLGTHFAKNIDFSNVQFIGDANFSGAQFEGHANFHSSIFQKGSHFPKSKFEKDAIFTLSKFTNKLNFYSSSFSGFLSFQSADVDQLHCNSCSIFRLDIKGIESNYSSFHNTSIVKADQESFRIIKDIFLKNSNKIEALRYRQKEMEEFHKKLKPYSSEWYILTLNRFSNFYGLKWERGIFFTLVVSAYFSVVHFLTRGYILCSDPDCWGLALQNWLTFIFPARSFDYTKGDPSIMMGIAVLFDLLGRIFVSYGIYQTITAFRKYRG